MVEVRLEEGVGREKNDSALSVNELWLRNAPPVVAVKAFAEVLGWLARLLHRSPTLWLRGNAGMTTVR